MAIVSFNEIGKVVTGKTPPTAKKELFNGEISFVTPGDLDGSVYIDKTKLRISEEALKFTKPIPKNSVMISCIGTLGKAGISKQLSATNQQINTIVVNENIAVPQYVYYYCNIIGPILKSLSGSTTVPIVNKTRFSKIKIPLPNLGTQRKIVAVLERADRLRAACRQVRAELDRLAQSIFLDMFGDFCNTECMNLEDIAELASGVTKGQKFKPGEVIVNAPYLRVANVQDGHLDLGEIKYIDVRQKEFERYKLIPGDVLLTEGGDFDKLGRGSLWKGELAECIHQNHIFRVRLNQKIVSPEFFSEFLRTWHAKSYFLKCAKRTTNLASINMTQLKKLPVPVPLKTLQSNYGVLKKKVDEARALHEQKVNELDTLFNALLQKAFKGELDFNENAFHGLEEAVGV